MDAQLDPPAPSTTVNTGRLDVMQAEAAAAVAGRDRLVLVVGPAGAGKTTMLAAAVDDLTAQGRIVFGVAPTAKAARVLESETGMGSDTVAKLLHEWRRTDRPPEPTWRLPVGATVIVDEAGMINTGDLHQLTHLADAQQWRLVLVGDPHQLQAVGRGGMFGELCATGRTIELDTIHRFHNQWEAAASLKLRHGDPGGLDAYLDHDRIFAAPFVEHVDNLAHYWAGARERGEYVAITTTTNDHVDAINTAVHDHRRQLGQLGDTRLELGDGFEVAVGDVITTRRNERFLRTTAGESVRNRDYWTIDTIGPDGSLAVTRIDGHGSVTLPAAYVAEHVQLGYAATEPGNQSDTATRSATLATTATTCRGLYVAITRGQVENLVLVVTDSHDVADAVDVLEQVLASDRADRPATSVRRDLAATTPTPPAPATPPPAPVVQPRCEIPHWYEETRQVVHAEFLDALGRLRAEHAEEERVDQRINELGVLLDELEPACQPHDDAIDAARSALDDAKANRRQLERTINDGGWRERRNARRELPAAERDVTAAEHHLDDVTQQGPPRARSARPAPTVNAAISSATSETSGPGGDRSTTTTQPPNSLKPDTTRSSRGSIGPTDTPSQPTDSPPRPTRSTPVTDQSFESSPCRSPAGSPNAASRPDRTDATSRCALPARNSASSSDPMTRSPVSARLTGGLPATNVGAMGIKGNNERHRVLVPQALGSDEFLRVTWHASRELIVFSHWDGDHCVAATPVRVTDIDDLASMIAQAAAHGTTASAWPPPAANTLVVPATGLTVPPVRRSA